jgi:hypothetical protein
LPGTSTRSAQDFAGGIPFVPARKAAQVRLSLHQKAVPRFSLEGPAARSARSGFRKETKACSTTLCHGSKSPGAPVRRGAGTADSSPLLI